MGEMGGGDADISEARGEHHEQAEAMLRSSFKAQRRSEVDEASGRRVCAEVGHEAGAGDGNP